MIIVENLHTYYGNIHAVKGISFDVRKGEITALIGANGAGKSTTMKTICGLLHPKRWKDLTIMTPPFKSWSADQIVRLGIGFVPEGRRVFPVLTVE